MFADAWKAEEYFLKRMVTISDLPEGHQYKICSVSPYETDSGLAAIAELEGEIHVFLPEEMLTMYIQCIHQKLYHLSTADYEEICSIILVARAAFQITPEGNAQFKDWLGQIRRSKQCKKDLWTQINAALQNNSK
ncbi:hypothetical protein DMENIID0001_034600 [Sergentomyia squamirostris]